MNRGDARAPRGEAQTLLDRYERPVIERATTIGAFVSAAMPILVLVAGATDQVSVGPLYLAAIMITMLAVLYRRGLITINAVGIVCFVVTALAPATRHLVPVARGDITHLPGLAVYVLVLIIVAYVAFRPRTARIMALVTSGSALAAVAVSGLPSYDVIDVPISIAVTVMLLDLLARSKLQTRDEAEHQRDLATTDGLTGLLNRRGIDHRLGSVGTGDALLLIDLDHFKQVNDQQGHAVGDEVLSVVAGALRAAVREGDLVARWGGEEFLVVSFRQRNPFHVELLGERIRQAVADAEAEVTASIGVATVEPNEDWEDALRRADAALYRAKSHGRNRVEMAG
ncbi:MAG: diguanylate cyclase [Acidimicrobiales bacterium]